MKLDINKNELSLLKSLLESFKEQEENMKDYIDQELHHLKLGLNYKDSDELTNQLEQINEFHKNILMHFVSAETLREKINKLEKEEK